MTVLAICLNVGMAAEENRLAHFRRLVESRSPMDRQGNPVLKEGYMAVAEAAGLTYDYVYQVYNGKSGKKGLGAVAMKKIQSAFGEGKPANWMDLPVDDLPLTAEETPAAYASGPASLEDAWETVGMALATLDDIGRGLSEAVLRSLAQNPENPAMSFQMLRKLLEVHGLSPKEPPPDPTKRRKTTAAAAKQPPAKASLVLKIGGGQKQQFDLPLVRSAFRTESAPANERAWYERLKAAPKANEKDTPPEKSK